MEGISITPLGTPVNELPLFRQQGLIRLTLEEAIPLNCQKREELIALLKGIPLTLVKTDANQVLKKDVGYTFPTTAPWCLLVAAYIRSLPFRPNLGDWGCGHGFFSQLALISGANPYAFYSSNAAANEANRLLWNTRSYLPEGLNIKELYKASWTSVVNPGENFMERKNHINVSFNVVHHLLPEQSDKFLKKLFINTEEGGFAILCADTPFGSRGGGNIILDFYNEGVKLGLKYAGYGVYSRSTITFLDNLTSNNYLDRKAYRPTKQDRKNKKFEMGVPYKGIFPVITKEDTADNGRTLGVSVGDPVDSPLNILHQNVRPYVFVTSHSANTLFDFNGLKNVMELVGFDIINGWYTDHYLDPLYPIGDPDLDNIRKSKVVIVAQKPKNQIISTGKNRYAG